MRLWWHGSSRWPGGQSTICSSEESSSLIENWTGFSIFTSRRNRSSCTPDVGRRRTQCTWAISYRSFSPSGFRYCLALDIIFSVGRVWLKSPPTQRTPPTVIIPCWLAFDFYGLLYFGRWWLSQTSVEHSSISWGFIVCMCFQPSYHHHRLSWQPMSAETCWISWNYYLG